MIFFNAVTFAAILAVERLEVKLANRFFKSFLEELERREKKLEEYYFYSILSIALKDREAYKGFQTLISEIYWQTFFQKLLFHASLFFLLYPYMILAPMFIPTDITTCFFLAIAYNKARIQLCKVCL